MSYLGIDLGTTNSVAIIYNDKNDNTEVVRVDGVDEILPSVVSYTDDGVIVGSEAKSGAIIYPESTVISVKRLMGSSEKIDVGSQQKLPEEISAEILKKLKAEAETQSGEQFAEVVITHPAYFNDRQIYATKKAGELAGFKNVYLLSEPLAAAIEYGYRQGYAQTLLVYDLGGGTFDACVLKVSKDENEQEIFQELSDVGDMNLGGDDFDAELISYFQQEFQQQTGIDIETIEQSEQKRVFQKLKAEAEQTKKKLSGTNKAVVRIYPLLIKDGVPKNLSVEITREDFEAMIRKYVDRSRDIIREALNRADRQADDISKVILVGGSTLIPMVKRMVAGFIKEPYRATDPAKSVAMGASIYNYLIHLPNSGGVKVGQITRQIFGTEAVVDVNTMEKRMIPIVPMGSPIPCKIADNNFGTMSGATNVQVDVYQWEQDNEEHKKYAGSVILEGLNGATQLEITYEIDENNLFEVSVRDMATGNIQKAAFDRTKELPPPIKIASKGMQKTNIVFIIDTTGSMDTYINGVKDRAIEFSNILSSKGTGYQLGLIGFGDLGEKENPSIYNFTDDVAKFQRQVKNIPRTYGGDIPESALDAVETAVELVRGSKLNPSSKNIFILITDAPPHIPTVTGKSVNDVSNLLQSNNITTYVVARKDKLSIEAYDPLTQPNGKYYDLKDKFYDILDNIAVSITELIRL